MLVNLSKANSSKSDEIRQSLLDLMPADGKSVVDTGVDRVEFNQLKEKNRNIQSKLLDANEKVE